MDIAGKTIAFTGRLHHIRDGRRRPLSRAEATRLVEDLGATVRKAPSRDVDLIFRGEGSTLNPATVAGVPILDGFALRHLLGERSRVPRRRAFADHEAIAAADSAELLTILERAHWSAFDAERDLPVLRERLAAIEDAEGISEVHRLATARLTDRRGRIGIGPLAVLHQTLLPGTKVRSAALSPCGRWLAVAGERRDPLNAALEFFEVETGRRVCAVSGYRFDASTLDGRDALRWAADSRRLAVAHDGVVDIWEPWGDWEPWSTEQDVLARAELTGVTGRPRYALDPTGRRVWIDADTGGAVPGVIANVERGHIAWDPADTAKERAGGEFTALAAELPEAVSPALTGDDFRVARAHGWSPDGRLLRFAAAALVFAVDTADGRVAWTREFDGGTAEFSPCGRHVAHSGGDALHIADARTGETLSRFALAARDLVWSADGERLAALSDEDGVHIVDTATKSLRRIAVTALERDASMPDATGFAFSRDAARGVVRTAGAAEVWSLAAEPVRLARFDAPGGGGVLWGAGDVVLLVGPSEFRAVRADGVLIARTAFTLPEGPNSLERDGENYGHGVYPGVDFVLDERTWGASFTEVDAVLVPPGRKSDVDGVLAWSAGNRHSWPLRWGTTSIVTDPADAHRHAVAFLATHRLGSMAVHALARYLGAERR